MKKRKILVVDDDIDFADSLADLLRSEKHNVSVVYSGQDAISAHQGDNFDFTLMDIKMPGMNGYEALVSIKEVDDARKVVMMTGFSAQELIDQAIDKGALCVLRKPIEVSAVLTVLQDY